MILVDENHIFGPYRMIKMVGFSIGGDVIDEWLALMSCIQLSHVWQGKWDGNSHWLIFRWDHQPLWDWGETDFPVPRMLGDSHIIYLILFVYVCCNWIYYDVLLPWFAWVIGASFLFRWCSVLMAVGPFGQNLDNLLKKTWSSITW